MYDGFVEVLQNSTATVYLDPISHKQIAFEYPNFTGEVICSKTFKSCHMVYVNNHWRQILDLIALKEKLDNNKQKMEEYVYNGVVKDENDNVIDTKWMAHTKAYSFKHALKTLQYQYKNEHNMNQGIRVYFNNQSLRKA